MSIEVRTNPEPEEITRILADFARGDAGARDRLMPLVYRELRRRAANQMRHERMGNSLQPTALVHEAYLKLVGLETIEWQNRAHFFAMASTLMRQILLDKARRDKAEKRGSGLKTIVADEGLLAGPSRSSDLLELDDALNELVKFDERKAKIVEMRFFGGLTEDEIACVLDISARTVKRDWRAARAWLHEAMSR
jgi:RNA polymerase sigma factor (TIGR02999 family)